MTRTTLCVILTSLFALPLLGQQGDTRILLPLVVQQPIPGAFGSEWVTRIGILNTSDREVLIEAYEQDCEVICTYRLTPPRVTFYPDLVVPESTIPASFLRTNAEDLPFIDVELHAQDLSRQSLTWGTEIPAVPETEALTGTLALGDIPIDERFRSLLRVYDFEHENGNSRVAYRVYQVRTDLKVPLADLASLPPDELLASGELILQIDPMYELPGYTQLSIDELAGVAGNERVRIELEPLTPGLRYWAFVSVTNNETQHITTITP